MYWKNAPRGLKPVKPSFFSLALLGALLLSTLIGYGCSGEPAEKQPEANTSQANVNKAGEEKPAKSTAKQEGAKSKPLPVVQTIEVAATDFARLQNYTSALEPYERVALATEIEGVVESATFKTAQEVEKGQVLGNISTERQRLQRNIAKTNHQLAAADHKRDRNLYRRKLLAKAKYQASRNKEKIMRYQLENANLDLKKSFIRAPIAGVVKKKMLDQGEFAKRGQTVAEILRVDLLKTTIFVPEQEVRYFHKGMQIELRFDAWPNMKRKGKILNLGWEADERSRTFPVEIEVPNPDRLLRPGMLARTQVQLETLANQVLIPLHSVLQNQLEEVVFVVKDGQAQRKVIKTSGSQGKQVRVSKGLAPGEQLMVNGQHLLTGNGSVKVAN